MSEQPTFDTHLEELAEARARRDSGRQQAVHGTHPAWKVAAEAELDRLAATGRPFTADDLWEAVGSPMASASSNSVGALFSAACKAGRIIPIGFTQTRRASGHARVIRQWRGAPEGGSHAA